MAEIGLGEEAGPVRNRVPAEPDGTSAVQHGARCALSRWLWYDRPVRAQLLGTFVLLNLVAGLAAAAIVVDNGRRAVQAELAASVEVAERFVRSTVEWLTRDPSRLLRLDDLAVRLRHARHVRIVVLDENGDALTSPLDAPAGAGRHHTVPRWFRALVQVETLRREVPVVSAGRTIGMIVVVGKADDEIVEIWQDVSRLALLALILSAAVIGVLYVALGRVLHPLTSLATGLRELEQGRYRRRLPHPPVRELADITARFNALADSLEAARADNMRLNRRLLTVQDDERRQIAMELHDELGPCLFGMKANIASLGRLAGDLPQDVAGRVKERLASLVAITDRMQVANRALLRKLRPMALGHVALADAIAGLVADFEGADPDRRFVLQIGRLARSYGSSIDLTVFRCLQEGITNAARHAGARTISVDVGESTDTAGGVGEAASAVLRLAVRDDGRGIPPGTQPGLGWSGMQERVRALGGRLSLAGEMEEGTRLEIVIPLETAAPAASDADGSP